MLANKRTKLVVEDNSRNVASCNYYSCQQQEVVSPITNTMILPSCPSGETHFLSAAAAGNTETTCTSNTSSGTSKKRLATISILQQQHSQEELVYCNLRSEQNIVDTSKSTTAVNFLLDPVKKADRSQATIRSKCGYDLQHHHFLAPLPLPSFEKNLDGTNVSRKQRNDHWRLVLLRDLINPLFRPLVTDFINQVLNQMIVITFDASDKRGNRSKTQYAGYRGLACLHCKGRSSNREGRYFPTSLNSLANHSTTNAMYYHLQKCQKVPIEVKQSLLQFYEEQNQHYCRKKMSKGSKRFFFSGIWDILRKE